MRRPDVSLQDVPPVLLTPVLRGKGGAMSRCTPIVGGPNWFALDLGVGVLSNGIPRLLSLTIKNGYTVREC